MVWTYQHFHFVIFIRYRRNQKAKNAHPQFWIIWKHAAHRIGGSAGKVRARLRQKTPAEWNRHTATWKKLTLGFILNGIKRAKVYHKGFPQEKQVGLVKARPPPKGNNRPASRFGRVAVELQRKYDAIPGAPEILLHGWLLNRLGEYHARERVMLCLRHAIAVMPPGRVSPRRQAAWICAVAARHLELDGLAPQQRRRHLKAGAHAPALKDVLRSQKLVPSNSGPDLTALPGMKPRKYLDTPKSPLKEKPASREQQLAWLRAQGVDLPHDLR